MKFFLRARALLLGACVMVAAPWVAGAQEAPKLVVSIVVDQLRNDLIDRYESVWSGGFRRLLDEGHRFTQASHAHARTSTAPGHATIATGVFPSRHGVVANSWQQRVGPSWRVTYAVGDPDSPIVGFETEKELPGRSPATMLRGGLADWLLAASRDSRTLSVSKKDRAAIPMGGLTSENVYWMEPQLGIFITSTHYMNRYPRWVTRFNQEVMPGITEPPIWDSYVPQAFRSLARADAAVYEGDGVHTTFPHVSADENGSDDWQLHNLWGADQPRVDAAVMAFTRTAMDELDLGKRDETDYLAISLSATDRVGHAYGPLSQEQLANLFHLDRLLGDFFRHLDEEIGEGAWVAGVTGDHGVATMPEAAREMGDMEAERIIERDVRAEFGSALQVAGRAGETPEVLAELLARAVERRGLVAKAYTHHDLTRGEPADSFAVLFRNSYYPGRAWGPLAMYGVEVRYGEGDYVGFRTGTNHESTYWYDRHVGMMFLGAGVGPGTSDAPVYTVDFAPTLAGLGGIRAPDDLDGRRIF